MPIRHRLQMSAKKNLLNSVALLLVNRARSAGGREFFLTWSIPQTVSAELIEAAGTEGPPENLRPAGTSLQSLRREIYSVPGMGPEFPFV
jgi:hypothetical protein